MPLVLIVDDNDAIRESLADALTDEGIAVESAPDGETALRLARERSPDVVLLDLMMPGLDGATVARRLHEQGSTARIVVVSADRGGAGRAREMGAARFLSKPFDLDVLLQVIAELAPA